jgi:hypothetical protein
LAAIAAIAWIYGMISVAFFIYDVFSNFSAEAPKENGLSGIDSIV